MGIILIHSNIEIGKMSIPDTFSKIECDDDCQVIMETFLPKIKKHFSNSLNTEIKSFLNSYENLFRMHIADSLNEYNFSKFTEELKEQLLEYCLRKTTANIFILHIN